jgi:Ca2+-binding RTX toxin-like protein
MVWRALVVLAFFLAITGSVYAFAAANTVPPTRLGNMQVRNYVGNDALKAQDFAPPECDPIRSSLTSIVYIGSSTPTNDSELVLGRPVADTINALGGDDCILGGGGNDGLCGGQIVRIGRGTEIEIVCTEGVSNNNDVIIGGPGNDSVAGGPGWDVCYGESDFDSSCEEFSPG